jgi:hypothetical protein
MNNNSNNPSQRPSKKRRFDDISNEHRKDEELLFGYSSYFIPSNSMI